MKKFAQVTRGHVTGTGKNKTEAKADLERQIDWMTSGYQGAFVECRHGHVIIVNTVATGFETFTIDPDKLKTQGRIWAGCHRSAEDILRVVMSCRLDVAMRVWTADVPDDALFSFDFALDDGGRSDLLRWIKFQRGYIVAKQEGLSDAEAHRVACDKSWLQEAS